MLKSFGIFATFTCIHCIECFTKTRSPEYIFSISDSTKIVFDVVWTA